MSAAASSAIGLANSPASGGDYRRPQVAVTIGLEWRLPPARASHGTQGTSPVNTLSAISLLMNFNVVMLIEGLIEGLHRFIP